MGPTGYRSSFTGRGTTAGLEPTGAVQRLLVVPALPLVGRQRIGGLVAVMCGAVLVACSAEDPATQGIVDQAATEYPTVLDMHTGLFAATCSPNPGVCHNTNNYPDLHTVGNLLAMIEAP